MDDDTEIKRYLHMDDDELYEELGSALLGAGIGVGPGDRGRYGKYGEKWFESRLPAIREALCGNPGLTVVRTGHMGDPVLQVATVSDCVAALAERPAAAVLAVLILRMGLNALCQGT